MNRSFSWYVPGFLFSAVKKLYGGFLSLVEESPSSTYCFRAPLTQPPSCSAFEGLGFTMVKISALPSSVVVLVTVGFLVTNTSSVGFGVLEAGVFGAEVFGAGVFGAGVLGAVLAMAGSGFLLASANRSLLGGGFPEAWVFGRGVLGVMIFVAGDLDSGVGDPGALCLGVRGGSGVFGCVAVLFRGVFGTGALDAALVCRGGVFGAAGLGATGLADFVGRKPSASEAEEESIDGAPGSTEAAGVGGNFALSFSLRALLVAAHGSMPTFRSSTIFCQGFSSFA
ncbi:hypothetical protein F5Y08DRAFT_309914 [Xylaria arbuscula]|nr:hypothetical protein F5Y08DRAFT_309914 [Xylaria arbuscula]